MLKKGLGVLHNYPQSTYLMVTSLAVWLERWEHIYGVCGHVGNPLDSYKCSVMRFRACEGGVIGAVDDAFNHYQIGCIQNRSGGGDNATQMLILAPYRHIPAMVCVQL
ncbi:hypothetical protein TRVL_06722 [Trypanosoma vivax]|nr:hypothetical protein TRVL_06722 [Trypanosoma vivax]